MGNYRATPLTPEAQERVEVKPKQQEPEVIIVSWNIHEDGTEGEEKETSKK